MSDYNVGDIVNPEMIASGSATYTAASSGGGNWGWQSVGGGSTVKLKDGSIVTVDKDGTILSVK